MQGTQIETNIITGGQAQWDVFSLVDRASIIRESFDGRMIDVEVKLSDWVFNCHSGKGSAHSQSSLFPPAEAPRTSSV
ncbi:replication initiator protein A [Sphingobium sp. CAP-1]|uniref:replication initiator protein A n=1 Tax=Sphingobium sp. CAP-1 TaxID=2676077 RepID=UPI003FA6D9D3